MRVPTVTIRRQVLESWLVIEDYTKARLAAELHVTRGRVSQLLSGQAEPSAHLIAKLLLLTTLPFHRLFQIVDAPDHPKSRNGDKHKTVQTLITT